MVNESNATDTKMAAELDKFSLYESFLEDVLYFLKDNQEINSLDSAANLVDRCIYLYCNKLVKKINTEPYLTIHTYVLKTIECSDFLYDLTCFTEPIQTYNEVCKICNEVDCVGSEDLKNTLIKHKDGYLRLLYLLTVILSIKSDTKIKGFAGILATYTMISSLATSELKGYFTSEEYAKHASKMVSSKGQQDRWDEHNEETMDVAAEAIKRMLTSDKKLHDKIVREVVNEYNYSIKNSIIVDLLKEYPDKDIDEEEMKKYKKDLNKRTHGIIVSYEKVKKLIYPLAKILGRANTSKK